MKVSIEKLCRDAPKEFEIYMSYIKNLQFSDDPDYEFLKDLFHKIFEAEGFSYESADFDWSKRGNLPTDVNRYDLIIENNLDSFIYGIEGENPLQFQNKEVSIVVFPGVSSKTIYIVCT